MLNLNFSSYDSFLTQKPTVPEIFYDEMLLWESISHKVPCMGFD